MVVWDLMLARDTIISHLHVDLGTTLDVVGSLRIRGPLEQP